MSCVVPMSPGEESFDISSVKKSFAQSLLSSFKYHSAPLQNSRDTEELIWCTQMQPSPLIILSSYCSNMCSHWPISSTCMYAYDYLAPCNIKQKFRCLSAFGNICLSIWRCILFIQSRVSRYMEVKGRGWYYFLFKLCVYLNWSCKYKF